MRIRHPPTFVFLVVALLTTFRSANAFAASFPKQFARAVREGCAGQETSSLLAAATLSRRTMISIGAGYLTASPLASRISRAGAEPTIEPLADLPMLRLRLPKGGLGREYVAIKLKVQGQGPYDFMLDTGLTAEFITPHLKQVLGINVGRQSKITGLAAGGGTQAQDFIELKGASLCCGKISGGYDELTLPTLHAVITDFPQEHIDPAHDPVEGMLGMEMLSMFDVDFDFAAGRLRLWKPGTAAAAAKNMVAIPAVVINETGLIGIRISAPGSSQPILGFLDCGSTFSAVNWAAASYLGFPEKGNPIYQKGPFVTAMGIDGRILQLPTFQKQLSFSGDIEKDPATGRPIGFAKPPSNWKPWDPVLLAVGDIPAFQSILGDGRTPYRGPAALIGLDILAQRRIILETRTDGTRQRRVFVSAS